MGHNKNLEPEIYLIKFIRLCIAIYFFIFIFYYNFVDSFPYIDPRHIMFSTEYKFLNYLLLLIFSIEIYSCLNYTKHRLQKTFKENKIFIAQFSILTLGLFLWFYYNSQYIKLWSDEFYQFGHSFFAPLRESSSQHQMPLSYYQSYIAQLLFSDIRFSIRFHTFLNYSLALGILFLTIKYLTKKISIALIALLLCLTNYCMLYHSVDARPQSLSFIYLLLYLLEFIILNKTNHINKLQGLSLFTVTTLLLLSIGLQPLVFILLFIPLYTLFYFKSLSIRKISTISIATFFALLFYLPFQLYTIKLSPGRFHAVDTFSKIKENLSQFHWFDFNIIRLFNNPQYGYYYVVVIFITLILLKVFSSKIQNQKENSLRFITFLFTLAFTFLFLLYDFYIINIDYSFNRRYTFLFHPLFAIALSLLLFKLSQIKISKLKLISLVLSVLLLLPLKFHTFEGLSKSFSWTQFDVLNRFEQIEKTAKEGSYVYCLSARWRHIYQYCSEVQHVIRRNNILNRISPIHTIYKSYPGYPGDWGPDLNKVSGSEFTFMFISNSKTISRLKEYLQFDNYIIDEKSYQITFQKKENLGKEIFQLLVKVKEFLDLYEEYEYHDYFSNFLEKQETILLK